MKKHSTKPKLFCKHYGKKEHLSQRQSLTPHWFNAPGVFETFRASHKKYLFLDDHLDRLFESIRGLGQKAPCSRKELTQWLERCLTQSKLNAVSARLAIMWQKGSTVLVLMIRPFKPHPVWKYKKGVAVKTSSVKGNHWKSFFPQIKSNQYVGGVQSFLESSKDHQEYIHLSPDGYLSEGTVSNLFLIKGGELWTPSSSCGILMGVTRQKVLSSARALGFPIKEKVLTRHDFYSCDEAFLTNTSSMVMPITICDGRKIGNGLPGKITLKLSKAFKERIKREYETN